MQGAAADGRMRYSPSTMDKADESAKKARLGSPNGHVKQELGVHEAAAAGGGAIVAAAEHSPRVELAVKIDMSVLHCPVCTLPFKPPVFQCKGGHLACGECVAQLPCGQCKTCADGAGFFDPCPALDAVVSLTRIECPNPGCQKFVTYHEAGEHQGACPHAPCRCTEPGCGYVGAAPQLAVHLNAAHSVPLRTVLYGKVTRIQVPVSTPRLLLRGEDDGRVFLLTVGALGGSATSAVSVVCARASAATRPRYTCKMWVNLAASAASNGGKADMVLVEMQVRSSASPGAVVAADEPTFLAVPPVYLVSGAGGDADDAAAAMEVPLHVRIDKISPWSD